MSFERKELKHFLNFSGSTLDFYEIGEELGKGGCATVYRCKHKQDGSEWALKRLVLFF